MDPCLRGDDAWSVIPAKLILRESGGAGIQAFFMHSGEPNDHGNLAQDDGVQGLFNTLLVRGCLVLGLFHRTSSCANRNLYVHPSLRVPLRSEHPEARDR